MMMSAMGCERCQEMRAPNMFPPEAVLAWTGETENVEPILCKPCLGLRIEKSESKVEMIKCHGYACNRFVPDYWFLERHLIKWRDKKTLEQEALCCRCYMTVNDSNDGDQKSVCKNCLQTKPMKLFTAVAIKSFYNGYRKSGSGGWVCQDCHFPACILCCKVPLHSVGDTNARMSKAAYYSALKKHNLEPHSAAAEAFMSNKKCYICFACKHPPCQIDECTNIRIRNGKQGFFEPWTCTECLTKFEEGKADKQGHTSRGWPESKQIKAFMEKALEFRTYFRQHGKLPTCRTSVGRWLYRTQKNFDSLLEEQQTFLKNMKEWPNSPSVSSNKKK